MFIDQFNQFIQVERFNSLSVKINKPKYLARMIILLEFHKLIKGFIKL